MDKKSCDIIQAILKQMGFQTFLESTKTIDDSKYDPNDNWIVIEGLTDINGHDVDTGA